MALLWFGKAIYLSKIDLQSPRRVGVIYVRFAFAVVFAFAGPDPLGAAGEDNLGAYRRFCVAEGADSVCLSRSYDQWAI